MPSIFEEIAGAKAPKIQKISDLIVVAGGKGLKSTKRKTPSADTARTASSGSPAGLIPRRRSSLRQPLREANLQLSEPAEQERVSPQQHEERSVASNESINDEFAAIERNDNDNDDDVPVDYGSIDDLYDNNNEHLNQNSNTSDDSDITTKLYKFISELTDDDQQSKLLELLQQQLEQQQKTEQAAIAEAQNKARADAAAIRHTPVLTASAAIQSRINFQTLESLSVSDIKTFAAYAEKVEQTGGAINRNSFISSVKGMLDSLWEARAMTGDWRDKTTIDTREFCAWMLNNTSTTSDDSVTRREVQHKTVGTLTVFIEKQKIEFNCGDIKAILTSQAELKREVKDTLLTMGVDDFSDKEHRDLIKLLSKKSNIKIMGSENNSKSFDVLFTGLFLNDKDIKSITKFEKFIQAMVKFNLDIKSKLAFVESFMGNTSGKRPRDISKDTSNDDKPFQKKSKPANKPANQKQSSQTTKARSTSKVPYRSDKTSDGNCTYCGKPKAWHEEWQTKHGVTNGIELCCVWANGHHNKDNIEFSKSEVGKQLLKDKNRKTLPFDTNVAIKTGMYDENLYDTASCGIMCNNNAILTVPEHKSEFINMRLTLPNNEYREVNVLLDTGAKKDYINKEVSSWLNSHGIIKEIGHANVCSAFSGVCNKSDHKIKYNLSLKNEFNTINQISNTATIIDSDIDIIIGRETI